MFVDNASESAFAFGTFFASVFSLGDHRLYSRIPIYNLRMLELIVTDIMVQSQLVRIYFNKPIGPDGLHPQLLKIISQLIVEFLVFLFNFSLK